MERETQDNLTWEGTPEQARHGCSLGNPDCFLRADADANLDGLWLAANNRWYCGELSLRLAHPTGLTLQRVAFAPASQSATYRGEMGLWWRKELALMAEGASVLLNAQGGGFAPNHPVELVCDWRISAARSEMHRAQPHGRDSERQWHIETELPDGARVRPLDGQPDQLILRATSPPLSRHWSEPARLRMIFQVPADAAGSFSFCLHLTAWGTGKLPPEMASLFETLPIAPASPFRHAQEALEAELALDAPAPTDSPLLNRAVAWGKICSRRVWHRYGTGDWGFTNDPPGNTIVTRDAAWFLFGADHFAPHWSRALLETLARHAVYPNGKIAEYVRLSPEGVARDDYGLNLNDATPLFILAVEHHCRTALGVGCRVSGVGEEQGPGARGQGQGENPITQLPNYPITQLPYTLLPTPYSLVSGAADWILQQRRDDGLIWCEGRGTNAWGIGGWRNVIPGYRLSGALTELNAECVAALRAAARLAEAFGTEADRKRFTEAAAQLDAAMGQLVDPQTGFFLLNRDENGPHPQLAIDLALPALFQVGPEEARVRTLLRLVEADFRCPAGLRTLSKNDPAYHPRFAWGLMGGSWPNATAWVAAALAPYRPDLAWELAEEIARSLFPETGDAPGVSVPGQFPEWFDGDTGESAGMSLSPWMPATFVWLILEGVGVKG